MVSFIIIGLNEGWKLIKCFESVFKTIKQNELNQYEVIYVDSNSTDNSIEIAKKYNVNKIFKITGKSNPAIGRNVGANESTGDILCFIDGDVEILPEFYPLIYSEEKGLVSPFVTGKIVDFYYKDDNKIISSDALLPALEDKSEYILKGPFFLITRKDWFSVGGMRNVLLRGEDHDLGLRLKRKGLPILVKKEVAAIHYTIDYHNKAIMWRDLLNGYQVYFRSVLYRKHLFNPFVYKKIISSDYTLIILFLAIIFTIFYSNLLFCSFYFILIFVKSLIIGKRKSNPLYSQYFYFIVRDLMNLFGFFLFYPKEVKEIKYDSVL